MDTGDSPLIRVLPFATLFWGKPLRWHSFFGHSFRGELRLGLPQDTNDEPRDYWTKSGYSAIRTTREFVSLSWHDLGVDNGQAVAVGPGVALNGCRSTTFCGQSVVPGNGLHR